MGKRIVTFGETHVFPGAPHSVSPGFHPALQTMGLLAESYYVLLMAFDSRGFTPFRLPGVSPRATNNGTPSGVLLCFVNGVWYSRGFTPFRFPGVSPRATNNGTPGGVLLCFVNGVWYSRGFPPFRLPGVSPRATNNGTPSGVLFVLC
ncbi:hypothetical protein CLV42_103487 [Chitinophaga ginsengisoli]|uniref:Uncharacterized protein n=1 Tax=Chitinophaga ginsengisoli TaxID=363837 RepID=A0A2P8GHQ5_9BACT|nr:hypothetical protein CLV42_103487 [Chitinophaga ginsengisoli]